MKQPAKNRTDNNTDPHNWEWDAESREPWELADKNWQDFCAYWYGATETQSAPLFDPTSPHLSLEPLDLPSRFTSSISSSIFVRKSYETMFNTVWERAKRERVRNRTIVTGQPGIGRTLFNYYLLVRLLLRRQVVIFSPEGRGVYLFYFGIVYTATMDALADHYGGSLPNCIFSSSVFIWSLFNIIDRKWPDTFMVYPSLPVQTVSPLADPIQYRWWYKELMPMITGLPLWTRDELAQGLKYQNKYSSLLGALYKVYGSPPTNDWSDPLNDYPGARELLEERYGEEGAEPPSPEEALDCFLDSAINRFGYSASDVFGAVFDYKAMTKDHEDAFRITGTYDDLQEAVNISAWFTEKHTRTPESYRILAIQPIYGDLFEHVDWKVDFKSDWVARSMLQKLGVAEDMLIRQQLNFYYRKHPDDRLALAGQFLEPLAHRYIAQTAAKRPWPLGIMVSNAADPPNFTLARDFPVPRDIKFAKVKRKIVELQSTTDLFACLGNNRYYIPTDPNFPLFDAFTIELDYSKKFAILWILQISTSRRRGCSAMGYRKIREIIAIVKEELREDSSPAKKRIKTEAAGMPGPLVQVRYLLIVPKDGSQSENPQWQFPTGWSQNWMKSDHRGKVYCLEVPRDILWVQSQAYFQY